MKFAKKLTFFLATIALIILGCDTMKPSTFGAHPKGARLERIKKSPQYRNGSFQNSSLTPMMANEAAYWKMLGWYTWNRPITTPPASLPFIKRNLKGQLPTASKPIITWFGHSSYLLQIAGKNILVDPVFCGYASPFSWVGAKSYEGANGYCVADLPPIDLVLLSHDHYDHLDYSAIMALKESVKQFVAPLGVGAHLEHWGVPANHIKELDWWDEAIFLDTIEIACTPARHFSGRGLRRAQSLWASYVLKCNNYTFYLGGDSGYDAHFTEIGKKFGPFDLAILECGQYHPYWKYIHMHPSETAQAARDLKCKILLPVHWSKFSLALHPWDESITLLTEAAAKDDFKIATPMIGEELILDSLVSHKFWWLEVK